MATYTIEQVKEKAEQLGVNQTTLDAMFEKEYANFEADGLNGIPDINKDSVVSGWVLFSLECL